MLGLKDLPLWEAVALFMIAGALIWIAGTMLARYVDALTDRIPIGRAASGMLLLGAITSLPEMSAVSTGAAFNNAALATNNLLGSLAINIAMIAVADVTVRGRPLTSLVKGAGTLFQAMLCMIALTLTVTAMTVGDRLVMGVGVWTAVIFIYVVGAFLLASRYSSRVSWRAKPVVSGPADNGANKRSEESKHRSMERKSTGALVARIAGAAVVIVCAGYVLSRTSEGIATQTGLKTNLASFILLGVVTSLPELATILSATRLQRYDMAIADVFGTNLFNLGLLVVADGFYRKGPILNQADKFEILATLLCMLMTIIYAVGLLERRPASFMGLGYDSIAALSTYLAGLTLLYYFT